LTSEWLTFAPSRRHVLVVAIGLDVDLFPEGEVSDGVLGLLAERLAFLEAVDATEASKLLS
jgi:hypothetical protein